MRAFKYCDQGLKKNPGYIHFIEKTFGRLNAGFFTGFSGKTGFFTENVNFWGTIATVKYVTHFKSA
jgi:hypothetical protein